MASILECGSETLVEHLLDECQLVTWLLNAPAEVQPISSGLRKGYAAVLASTVHRPDLTVWHKDD